ncbi:hypothetical protein LTR94_032721, partial [Friedmanniomyces endolithicus]
RAVFDAFGLPWIGSDDASATAPIAPAAIIVVQPIVETPPDDADDPPQRPGGLAPIRPARPIVSAPKPKRLMPTKSELEILREQIRSWTTSDAIQNGSRWNEILFLLVEEIDSRAIGVPPPLFQKLITRDMVKLQGTATRHLDYFKLSTEAW